MFLKKQFIKIICFLSVFILLSSGCGSTKKKRRGSTRRRTKRKTPVKRSKPVVGKSSASTSSSKKINTKEFKGYPKLIEDFNFTKEDLKKHIFNPRLHINNCFKDFKKSHEMKKIVRDTMKEVNNAKNSILTKISKIKGKNTITADVNEWLNEVAKHVTIVEESQKNENYLKAAIYAEKALISINDVIKKVENYDVAADSLTEFTYRGYYTIGNTMKAIIQKTLLKVVSNSKSKSKKDLKIKTSGKEKIEKGKEEKKIEEESKMEIVKQEIITVLKGDKLNKDKATYKVFNISATNIKFKNEKTGENWILYLEAKK